MAIVIKDKLPLLFLFLSTLFLATSVSSTRGQRRTCEEECKWVPAEKMSQCVQDCHSYDQEGYLFNSQSCEDRCMRQERSPQQQEQCRITCRQQQGRLSQCRQQCQRSRHPGMCERMACRQQGQRGGRADERGCEQDCVTRTSDPWECKRICRQQQGVYNHHQGQQQYEQQCRLSCQSERGQRQQQCQEECAEQMRKLEECQEECQIRQGQYGQEQQECQRTCRQQFQQGQGIRMVVNKS